MNTRKHIGSHSLLTAFALTLVVAPSSFAQGLVMSTPEAQRMVSPKVDRLVEAAFPVYDQADLEKRLSSAAATLQSRADNVTMRTLAGVERLMGFQPTPSRALEVDTATAYYRVDPSNGKAYAQHKRYDYTSISREAFGAVEKDVRAQHLNFLNSLGLPRDEIMKSSFRKVLVQSLADTSTGNTDGSPATVRRGLTLGYRGFAGFPIEGSVARISSFDARRVENVSLSWPRFTLHPEVTRVVLANKDIIKRNIINKIKASSTVDQPLSLVMGVVFRAGKTPEGKHVHLPAMKVVVTPSPKEMSGVQTEAGLEFYADILTNPPRLQADDFMDRE